MQIFAGQIYWRDKAYLNVVDVKCRYLQSKYIGGIGSLECSRRIMQIFAGQIYWRDKAYLNVVDVKCRYLQGKYIGGIG